MFMKKGLIILSILFSFCFLGCGNGVRDKKENFSMTKYNIENVSSTQTKNKITFDEYCKKLGLEKSAFTEIPCDSGNVYMCLADCNVMYEIETNSDGDITSFKTSSTKQYNDSELNQATLVVDSFFMESIEIVNNKASYVDLLKYKKSENISFKVKKSLYSNLDECSLIIK